jgi:hypothetical protein
MGKNEEYEVVGECGIYGRLEKYVEKCGWEA